MQSAEKCLFYTLVVVCSLELRSSSIKGRNGFGGHPTLCHSSPLLPSTYAHSSFHPMNAFTPSLKGTIQILVQLLQSAHSPRALCDVQSSPARLLVDLLVC